MSNVTLNAGTGGATLGTDTVAGIDYQKIKPAFSTDGVAPVSVDATHGLPVNVVAGSVGVTGVVTVNVNDFPATQAVSGTVTANQGTANTLANAWPHELTDGTTGPVAVKAASTAAAATDKALVVAVSPNNSVAVTGTVTANQGTANTAANAWFEKVTDGTNTAAVKAASTAAVAADPALVVAVSPNNSVAVTGTVTTTPPANASTNVTQVASTALGVPQTFGTAPTGVVVGTSSDLYVAGTRARSNQTTTAAGAVDVNIVGSLGVTNSVTNGTFASITDGTTKAGVIAGTTALKTDMSSVAGTATVTAAAGVQKVGIVGNTGATLDAASGSAVPTNGQLVGGGSVAGATNFTALTVKAASTAAAATDTSLVVQPLVGSAVMSTAAAGVQKVGISGATAATLDAVITAATAPANGVATLGVCQTTAPALTVGQSVAAQVTWDGSLFVQNVRRTNVKAATGTIASTTAATMLAAQAAGVFADLAGLVLTVAAIATTADAIITVNISDGTATYKFGVNTGAITTVGNVDTDKVVVNFSPPIPATAAATAWTIALSTANTTVAYVATFILQKAS